MCPFKGENTLNNRIDNTIGKKGIILLYTFTLVYIRYYILDKVLFCLTVTIKNRNLDRYGILNRFDSFMSFVIFN